ncbi:hypothetical protein U9R90_35020, partial [Streptomyces sp. E11-3]|uniref:hypothetical protein n=1 Tax=Streptomyces sp. E11-3 TaxID=3110112 RepID=UPI00397F58A2
PVRALAVGLLNLSGLGLGYVLLRRWVLAAVCWAATAGLLVTALPAEADGIAGVWVISYAAVLLLAAADGARRGYRAAILLPGRPLVAAVLGLALLAVPAGGAVAYGSAKDEAMEKVLLERLEKADAIVKGASGEPFTKARPEYRLALQRYRSLGEKHSGSRAGKLVPKRLDAYYQAVAAPYHDKDHCTAIEPLTYLRTVPDEVDGKLLGELADWPDDPLATSLYECGIAKLGTRTVGSTGGDLGELLRTFPDSEQAGQVEPAIRKEIKNQVGKLKGSAPCTATDQLRRIGDTAKDLPDSTGDALSGDVDSGVESGTYACGVDQFEDKKFSSAQRTMNDFARTYKNSSRTPQAKKIAIAAEIATARPQAGKRLPRKGRPGGARMELVITNDAPNPVEILYTGSTTGSVKIPACANCKEYADRTASRKNGCASSSKKYRKTTLRLPAGDYHFLAKYGLGVRDIASGRDIQPGYRYTTCTVIVRSGSLGSLGL